MLYSYSLSHGEYNNSPQLCWRWTYPLWQRHSLFFTFFHILTETLHCSALALLIPHYDTQTTAQNCIREEARISYTIRQAMSPSHSSNSKTLHPLWGSHACPWILGAGRLGPVIIGMIVRILLAPSSVMASRNQFYSYSEHPWESSINPCFLL